MTSGGVSSVLIFAATRVGDRVDGRRRAAPAPRPPQPAAGADGAQLGALRAHEDDLRPAAGGEAGRDEVGAFHQEGAFTLAELALTQRRRPLDEGVLRAAEWFA